MSASADLVLTAEQQLVTLALLKALREDLAALMATSRQLDDKWVMLLAEVRSA